MKLQILVPQYDETDEIIKPLLDSIAIQQNVNFNEIGVIICNDGSNVFLSDTLLSSYPFKIEYYKCKHKGVSATRNECLDKSTADYVMFCDADDMFYNACGLYIIFREMNIGEFDSLVSSFIEESKNMETKESIYITHEVDSTFVHGKIHRRKYLIDNNIRWNENLTIHEDSFFNILCQKLSNNVKFCPTPFYLWKWRDNSVCRHDDKYILKTYNNMIDSNSALVKEFLKRDKIEEAQFHTTFLIYEAYFMMNKREWRDQENKKYRDDTEKRFYQYYKEYEYLYKGINENKKAEIIYNIKNRMFTEGLFLESITFKDWIDNIIKKYK